MAFSSNPTLIAKSGQTELHILPKMANRHGLITGATGTGKTVTLQVIAESFSMQGIPVFMTDVKGDLSGISQAGSINPKIQERIDKLGLNGYENKGFPVVFLDVFGEKGHPVRTTISEMGPLLMARLLNLNETQAGVLNIAFRIADENGLLLLDLKDLSAMLRYIGENRNQITLTYGNVAAASVGAIQRSLLMLEGQGGDMFFGEPSFNIHDLLQTDTNGNGMLNIMTADKLMNSPLVYSTFLLWLLSELFEQLPEIGDPEKPVLAFFFDEAHLLFSDIPKILLDKIEQVVRLIRSKGVGVYFVTQNPMDIPPIILGQLGNRVQHALRAYTPLEQQAVRTAADTFRPNPSFKTEEAISNLAVGEALVSFLDPKGIPTVVERALILPPCSQIGPIDDTRRRGILANSILRGVYDEAVDRESAFEMLQKKVEAMNAEKEKAAQEKAEARAKIEKAKEEAALARAEAAKKRAEESKKRNSVFGQIQREATRAITRNIGSSVGRSIIRGILGSLFGGKR